MIVHEEWRPCFDGSYAVSSLGRVRRERGGRSTFAGRPVKVREARGGYVGVELRANGRRRHEFVHRLVAAAFIGSPPAGMEVNHKNGDKTDNRACNLEYVTPAENCQHAHRTGLNRTPDARINPQPGERNGRSKLTDADVLRMRARRAAGASVKELVAAFGVGKSSVDYITRRVSWRHLP